jgi:S-adenosylmethionine:tRNA ribosyltransferase-isomerase
MNEYSSIMAKKEKLRWKCLIGGASKWKEGPLVKKLKIQDSNATLQARLVEKLPDAYVVELSWQPAHFSFAEIIELAGDTPLPPYIKRKPMKQIRNGTKPFMQNMMGQLPHLQPDFILRQTIFSTFRKKKFRLLI